MTTIVIAERSEVVAQGIATLCQNSGITVIGILTSEDELLQLLNCVPPDLILFGCGLPSSSGSFESVLKRVPEALGIAIRDAINAAEVFTMAEQGVLGILHVDAKLANYRACLGSVQEKCQWIDPKFFASLLRPPQTRASDLTGREVEIIDMVRRGWRNKQIARELGITEGTVKMHLHHILTKTGFATRREVALAAARAHASSERLTDRYLTPGASTGAILSRAAQTEHERLLSGAQGLHSPFRRWTA